MTVGGIGSRRESRERALTLLYESASREVSPAQSLADAPVPPHPYARELVLGVDAHGGELDAEIDRVASGWTVERMPVIDVNILRMALWELTHKPDVPAGAVISEAVELASQFSTERSARFVNGVLARLARELRPGESTPEIAPDLDEASESDRLPNPDEFPDLSTLVEQSAPDPPII